MIEQADSGVTTEAEPKESSERTCAGCRQQDARESLVRLAVSDDETALLVPDLRGRLGGRGVSVHATRRCLSLAANKGGFARSLRRAVVVDDAALARSIEERRSKTSTSPSAAISSRSASVAP